MDLPNLKELKAILKLCRSQGVTDITIGNVTIKFGDMPMVAKNGEMVAAEEDVSLTPSDEDMAYWSAAPDPLGERISGSGAQ